MTKLTQQEIEKEREMFEETFGYKFIGLIYMIKEGYFNYEEAQIMWQGWLARAELAKKQDFIVIGKKVIPNNIAKLMNDYDMPWEVFWCYEHSQWLVCLDTSFPYHMEQGKCKKCLQLSGAELAKGGE